MNAMQADRTGGNTESVPGSSPDQEPQIFRLNTRRKFKVIQYRETPSQYRTDELDSI